MPFAITNENWLRSGVDYILYERNFGQFTGGICHVDHMCQRNRANVAF